MHSGFDLVPHRRARKTASVERLAKIDFEPWKRDGELMPSDDVLKGWAIACRLANAVMCRTKEQLMDGKLTQELLAELLDDIHTTAEKLKAAAMMCEAAEVRLLSAASAAVVRKSKPTKRKH